MKLVVVSLGLAVVVLGLLATPAGIQIDHELARLAGGLARQSPPLRSFMEAGTRIGSSSWVLAGLLLPGAFGPTAARATVRACALGLAGNQATVSGLKWAVDRPRPSGAHRRSNSSFPSAHAAAAAGIAWTVSARHRRLAAWAWLVAAWVAASRVFLERHYPSDVLAGALIGILFAALALRLESRLAGRRRDAGV